MKYYDIEDFEGDTFQRDYQVCYYIDNENEIEYYTFKNGDKIKVAWITEEKVQLEKQFNAIQGQQIIKIDFTSEEMKTLKNGLYILEIELTRQDQLVKTSQFQFNLRRDYING